MDSQSKDPFSWQANEKYICPEGPPLKRPLEDLPDRPLSKRWASEFPVPVPKELLEVCYSHKCGLCDVKLTPNICENHYKGEKHHKSVARRLVGVQVGPVKEKDTKLDIINLVKEVDRDPSLLTLGDSGLVRWHSDLVTGWTPSLPREAVVMCRADYCHLCRLSMSSPKAALSHYSGKSHSKVMIKWLQEFCKGENVPLNIQETKKEFLHFCKFCEVELTSAAMARIHNAGRKHQSRLHEYS